MTYFDLINYEAGAKVKIMCILTKYLDTIQCTIIVHVGKLTNYYYYKKLDTKLLSTQYVGSTIITGLIFN